MNPVSFISLYLLAVGVSASARNDKQDELYHQRIQQAKLDLWLHGAFDINDADVTELEMQVLQAPFRHGPIRDVRRRLKHDMQLDNAGSDVGGWQSLMQNILNIRGGGVSNTKEDDATRLEKQLAELSAKYGQPFIDAIELNEVEHAADCKRSCELFYCAPDDASSIKWDSKEHAGTTFASYSFGSVPPEDFSDEFQ